ncbi:MAG: membrane protein insertase YidC [Bacteroidetes bacterium]|nr:membrane protein insertase YidC [Bacteroidota bacterium]
MDRNSIIGLLLILGILIGYSYLNQPSAEQIAERKHISDSIAAVKIQQEIEAKSKMASLDTIVKVATLDSQALQARFGEISQKFFGEEKEFTLKNEDVEITISNKGARVNKAHLLKYLRADTSQNRELILFDKNDANDYFVFNTKNDAFYTNKVYWDLVKSDKSSLTFKLNFDADSYIETSYKLDDKGYGVNQQFSMVNMEQYIQPNSLLTYYREVEVPKQELKAETERTKSTIYYRYLDEKPDYISETKYKSETLKAQVQWVSFTQQFFNTTVILKEGFLKDGEITVDSAKNQLDDIKHYKAQLDLPFENRSNEVFNLRYYFGPNHYKTLKKEEIELEDIIPLGWTLFRWVNSFLVIPTFNFLSKYINNYGIIILLLTIFIKMLLLPLVYKSYLSTAKMRLLKPELDEIKEKNKGDMAKVQMETMSLYKKAGVSPMGGCLPMVLQFPILIAMFTFFPSSFELRQQPFLWASDLSRYDSIFNFPGGFSLPFYGDHVSLFTLLMTASTIIYTRLNNQLTAAGTQMKIISYVMPIMFLGFFNNYPAALSYYYFLANMITFGQQAIFKRFVDEDKLHKQIAESKKKKVNLKKSSFQKRLEDYAKKRGIDPYTGKRK